MKKSKEKVVTKDVIQLSGKDFIGLLKNGVVEDDDTCIQIKEEDRLRVVAAISKNV